MSRTLTVFLAVALGWAALVGLGLHLADVDLGSVTGVVVLAVVYMPSPFVAALVAERGLVRSRFRLPRASVRAVATFLLAPAVVVVAAVLALLGVVLVAGSLLDLPGFGALALTSGAVVAGAAELLGPEAVAEAGPPPPVVVLLLAGVWGALLAGWTVNGLVAMGEEYGWRGLMWEELRHLGVVRASAATGLAWGLWHAPVVVQGYNYPGSPVLGVVAMVVFCTGFSVALAGLRELTGSVLPVAAAHGMFNALAPIALLLSPGAHPVVAGPVGVVSGVLLALVGALLWARVRGRAPATDVAGTQPVSPGRTSPDS